MTALELKMIAWIMMTAGYLGEIFFPGSFPLAAAGTVALPLFAYLTAESCRYTHRWPGYMKRLLLLAVVCEIPFDLATSGLLFWPLRQSPVVSQLLAVAGIAFFDRYSDREWRFLPLVGACILSAFLISLTYSIDDFIISYFSCGTLQTLPIAIYSMTRKKVSPEINALSTIMFVAILCIILVSNALESRSYRKKRIKE